MIKYVNGVEVELTDSEAETFELSRVIDPVKLLADRRSAATVTRAEFAVGAAKAGWITETEAEEWGAGVAIPAVAATAIATLPKVDRFRMRMSVRTRQKIWRNDTLVLMLMTAQDPQVSADQMDAFFGVEA
jgi:hypothetical protein